MDFYYRIWAMDPKEIKIELTFGIVIFVFGVAVLLSWSAIFGTVTPDGLIYCELARNLFHSGYVVEGEYHDKFLPLLPLLMALGSAVAGGRLPVEFFGYAVNALSSAGLAVLTFWWCRRLRVSRGQAVMVAVLLLVCPMGLGQCRDVSVLPIYALLQVWWMYLLWDDRPLAAGLVGGLAVTTRFEPYLFLPVAVLLFVRRPRSLLLFATGFIFTASPWLVHNFLRYRQLVHSRYMAELFLPVIHLKDIGLDLVIDFGLMLAATGVGLARMDRKPRMMLLAFAGTYLALHLVWWWYDARFLLPLAPAVLIAGAVGWEALADRLRARWPSLVGELLLAAVLSANLAVGTVRNVVAAATQPPDPYLAAARYLRESVGPGEAVACSNTLLVKHHTGLPVFSLLKKPGGEAAEEYVARLCRAQGIRWLVWTNVVPEDWLSYNFLKEMKDRESRVMIDGRSGVLRYRFVRSWRKPHKFVLVYRVDAVTDGPRPPDRYTTFSSDGR